MRGLLLALLLKAYPHHAALVVLGVGLLFGCLHLINLLHGTSLQEVLPQVIWSCGLGVAFAVITFLSGSLIPAILLHCLFNLIPAVWDAKPWVLAKTSPHGTMGLVFLALIFFPLAAFSMKRLLAR